MEKKDQKFMVSTNEYTFPLISPISLKWTTKKKLTQNIAILNQEMNEQPQLKPNFDILLQSK